jgi:hypothetical protein
MVRVSYSFAGERSMKFARMSAGDFLKKEAATPLQEHFLAAGATCELSTNSRTILAAARCIFVGVAMPGRLPDVRLRFWVDPGLASEPPWPRPYVRGLGHLVFAGLDTENSFLIDRRALRGIGRFSPAMAADQTYWKMAVLPMVVSLFGGSIGTTELHCGCVVDGNSGLLLAGQSGSGKSTLSWALTRLGFSFLSDDRTHLSRHGGQLLAWCSSSQLKLRPEAATLFPELCRLVPIVYPDGQRAFNFDPEEGFGVSRSRFCRPRWLIFLEPQAGVRFRLTPMEPVEAAQELRLDLLAETPEISEMQVETIAELVGAGCWRLAYSGDPCSVAKCIARFCKRTADPGALRPVGVN